MSSTSHFSSRFVASMISVAYCNSWIARNERVAHENPVFLSSFPRSGNGWVRLIMAGILLEMNGIDVNQVDTQRVKTNHGSKSIRFRTPNGTLSLEDIFPDMYVLNSMQGDANNRHGEKFNLPVRLLKTHHLVDCSKWKTIFLFRSPINCLTSAAIFFNRRAIQENPKVINQTMLYLAHHYQKMLATNVNSYRRFPGNCFLLANETLNGEYAAAEFVSAMRFVGQDIDHHVASKVISRFPLKSVYNRQVENSIDQFTRLRLSDILDESYHQALGISYQQGEMTRAVA